MPTLPSSATWTSNRKLARSGQDVMGRSTSSPGAAALSRLLMVTTNVLTGGTTDDIIARLDQLPYVAHQGAGDDMLRFVGVSVTLDGACGCLDSVQPKLPEWNGDRIGANRDGIARVPEEKYRTLVREATRRGMRVTHQSRRRRHDRASPENLWRSRRRVRHPRPSLRPHAQRVRAPPAADARVKSLGILPTTCISFLWNHGMNMVRAYGEDVVNRAVPLRSWLDAGIPVSNGTDGSPWNLPRAGKVCRSARFVR